ncbi:MAG TPA: hypothetical protein VK395_03490 [Gemmataceae bacterium]|nr:hypothetical protein [Gemmataceae bacterium]
MTLGKSLYPGGAKCGALHPDSLAIDPALAKIIAAWPKLPEAVKAGIVAFAQAASGSDSEAQAYPTLRHVCACRVLAEPVGRTPDLSDSRPTYQGIGDPRSAGKSCWSPPAAPPI